MLQTVFLSPTEKRKANRLRLHEKVRTRVKYLYNVQRKRIDDVYRLVADEFCMEESTVAKIMKTS